jgi:integrator complex subunit 6
MTIILFLIDTSASMSQEAFVNGVHKSYLDIAKGAVETFLKYRQRSQDCMGDRYMLLTFEDPPNNIKAGWKENHATFMNELKNLQSNGLTTVGEALKGAFDLLNLNRMQSGIDTYGQGRCPFYLEPSIIILITDGGRYSHRNGIDSQLSLPLNINIPGAKLTKEPFRWDQRLFSLILRMSGHKGDERTEGKVPHDDSPLEKMCEVTGGRSYKIRSQYVLNQCIESLVQKAQPGVVINFDPVFKEIPQKDLKEGEIPEMIFQNTKKMIYVPKVPNIKSFPIGYWPLPESYWPDVKMTSLPPRDAHPRIKISLTSQDEPTTVRNFPIDKYELEGSPLTLWILSKKDPNKVFPINVVNSNGGNLHDPMLPYRMHQQLTNDASFGYLKAHSTMMVVHLYVLPYNYQYLLPLLSELVHKLNLNPTSDWINKFATYVKNIPQYYCPFLRKALSIISIPYQLLQYILPESLDSYLSPNVANQLKQMKNMAKQDQENLCMRVFKQLKLPKMPYHQHETVKLNCGQQLKTTELVKHPMLRETFQKIHSEINVFDNYNIVVPTVTNIQSTKNYRNPFDIPRRDLIDEISRMRDNFFKIPTCNINLLTKDAGHSLPIAEMGNYQEYLKRRETPLRELEPTNVRQHMFGNPYKRDKHMVMVDEADDERIDPSTPNNKIPNANKKDIRMSRKRKAGPIRKDFIFKRARYDFGFPASPGLPCPPTPTPSEMSDNSDTESTFSIDCDDDSRSTYSDASTDSEYRRNGHMPEYNFDSILNESNEIINPPTNQHLFAPQQYPPVQGSIRPQGTNYFNLK